MPQIDGVRSFLRLLVPLLHVSLPNIVPVSQPYLVDDGATVITTLYRPFYVHHENSRWPHDIVDVL